MQQLYNKRVCLLAVVGTLFFASTGMSHVTNQMNISNTWTLPQDGFTLFYRFFRDKISWYEADAVCQFHHANLVTVGNSIAYDVSRAFLEDLNVTEKVWIGLKKAENSERFVWSNTKILDQESSYWAEQIPVTNVPLCAVIDPIHGFRWHSLHCGGPDVAAFLCELQAPDWASDCMITTLPSLSIQYMSDSGTVELTRDCGLEGIKRISCSGKQDNVDLLKRALMCLSERESEEGKSTTERDITSTVAASATVINANEPISDQIEKPIEKTLDSNAPIPSITQAITPSKPNKSSKKIALEKPLKNNPKLLKKYKLMLNKDMDDMMMGDQPVQYIPKIEDALPHTKKALQVIEPEHTHTTTESKKSPLSTTNQQHAQSSSSEMPTTKGEATSPEKNTRSRRNSETGTTPMVLATTEAVVVTSAGSTRAPSTEASVVTSTGYTATSTESTTDKSVSGTAPNHNSTQSPSDHFVPPMLLVHHDDLNLKSSPSSIETGATVTTSTAAATITETTSAPEATTATATTTTTMTSSTAAEPSERSTEAVGIIATKPTSAQAAETVQQISSNPKANEPTTQLNAQPIVPSAEKSFSPSTVVQSGEAVVTPAAPSIIVPMQTAHDHPKPNGMMRPHAPKHGGEIHFHAPNAPPSKIEAIKTESSAADSDAGAIKPEPAHMPARNPHFIAEISNDLSPHDNKTADFAISTNSVDLSHTTAAAHDTVHAAESEAQQGVVSEHGELHEGGDRDVGLHDDDGLSGDEGIKRRADFTNSELDYIPYKPNRRRVLRKPQAHSYIQRVFGRR